MIKPSRDIFGEITTPAYVIDEAGLRRCANGKVLARPHFAQYLVEHGKAVTKGQVLATIE